MKLFKKVDAWLQIILIAGGVIFCVFNMDYMYIPYFLVGGWQLLSCGIHLFFSGHFITHRWRNMYYKTLIALIVLLFILYLLQWVLAGLFTLLFLSPLLACWYAFTCREENTLLAEKELIHFK